MKQRVHPNFKGQTTPGEKLAKQARLGDETAEGAKYIKGPAVRYRNLTYVRYLLMGLLGRGKVDMAAEVLKHLTLQGEEKAAWLNDFDNGGGLLPYAPHPMQCSLLLTAVLMPNEHGIAAKVAAVDMLLEAGAENVNDFYQPEQMFTVGVGRYREAGVSPFAALCDPAFVGGVAVDDHKRLVRRFLELGGMPFKRMGQGPDGACPYERAYVHYPYLLAMFPDIPLTREGFTDETLVDRGPAIPWALEKYLWYDKMQYHGTPFRWKAQAWEDA